MQQVKKRKRLVENGKTSAQQLSSVIKSAWDIMRKDRGLSGDSDRLPQLTWLLFLKFIDDNERMREFNAGLEGVPFKPAIQKPYRWRDWAAPADGMTGDDLKNFINNDEATLPNGKQGKACSNISRTCAATGTATGGM